MIGTRASLCGDDYAGRDTAATFGGVKVTDLLKRPTGIYGAGAATPHTGILTYDGRRVGPDGGAPSVRDIALGLSRMPRFAGQGRGWWTVLDHSMHVAKLAWRLARDRGLDEPQARALELAALLHDAHEAITEDVPTPWKTDGLKTDQRVLDVRIANSLYPGFVEAFDVWRDDIKRLDRAALLAEAAVYGPPALMNFAAVAEAFGEEPDRQLVLALKYDREHGKHSDPANLRLGIQAPEVRRFLDRYLALR